MKKRMIMLLLAAVLVLSLAACGGGRGDEQDIDDTHFATYAYLPTHIELPDMDGWLQGMVVHGDRIFYYFLDHNSDDDMMDFNRLPEIGDFEDIDDVDGYNDSTDDIDNSTDSEALNDFDDEIDWDNWTPPAPDIVVMSVSAAGDDFQEIRIPAESGSMQVAGFHVTDEGHLAFLIVTNDWSEAGSSVSVDYLVYTMDGERVSERDLSHIVPAGVDWFSVDQAFFLADGRMALTSWAERGAILYLLDREGRTVGELEMDSAQGITELPGGRIVMTDWEQDGDNFFEVLRVVDFDAGEWDETYRISFGGARNLRPAGDYPFDFLMDDGVHLTGYNMETGQRSLILNWIEVGLASGWDYSVGFLDDGRIAVLTSTWTGTGGRRGGDGSWQTELMVLTRVPRAELPERTVLTLGGMWFSEEVRQAIVAFNRESQTAQIQVKDYSLYSTPDNWRAGANRFAMDLATGRGPDLVWMWMGDIAIDMGLLADLYTFIDADPVLNRSDFFPNILQAVETSGGSLPMLPNAFGVQTMIGMADTVGHIDSWTLADMLRFVDETDVPNVMGEWLTGENFIWQALAFDGGAFLDWDENRAHLDNADFIDLLEVAARLPAVRDDEMGQSWAGDEFTMMCRGEQLLNMTWLSHPDRFQEMTAALGEIVALGVPTADGGAHVISPREGLGINAASAHQDEAWAFVRRFLLPEATIGYWDFPVRLDLFNAMMEEAMTPLFWTADDPWREGEIGEARPHGHVWLDEGAVPFYAMTAEDAAALREIVETASIMGHFDEGVFEMVREELLPFFAGDRSAADTARILQNRVQTFMSERR
ncbi:MAG: extracellular solute-binding protein [Oscillospiraceae bacterium]|nr:extracellular solute-binding protein [Oscillospiraceae bacterium]